jgi:hypothetical protein
MEVRIMEETASGVWTERQEVRLKVLGIEPMADEGTGSPAKRSGIRTK